MFEIYKAQLSSEIYENFSKAFEKGFLTISKYDRKIENIYREYCQNFSRPIIIVKTYKRFTCLLVDMYPTAVFGKFLPQELLNEVAINTQNFPSFPRKTINRGFVEVHGSLEIILNLASKISKFLELS